MKWTHWICAAAVMLWSVGAFAAADGHPAGKHVGEVVTLNIEPQPWQVRRAEFLQAVNNLVSSQGKDAKARADIDARLTLLEKQPLELTPMEKMDLFGAYYVPREGARNMLKIIELIAMEATLGWYDALRFADASGRAEIVNNEAFFKRAFILGGEAAQKQFLAALQDQPDAVSKAVATGIATARRFRNAVRYDVRWPTAYGLGPMGCALSGGKDCPPPSAMPREKWDAAFEEAAAHVERYYRDNSKSRQ